MKFWCATAFMKTKQLVHIAQLLDEEIGRAHV